MEGTLDKNLLNECNTNFIKAFEMLGETVQNGLIERTGGVTIVRTGSSLPGFNLVFALDRPASLDGVVDRIKLLLVSTKTKWRLVTTNQSLDYLKRVIEELHLVQADVEPGMVLDLADSFPFSQSNFEIRTVKEKEEIATLVTTGTAGFGAPSGSMGLLEDATSVFVQNTSYRGACYLGYFDGQPVGTSLRIVSGRIAGVYFVSVIPQFRRRGFGEALARRAALDGRTEGCGVAYLQASKMGFPIYLRMGFRTITEYQLWSQPTDS